MIATLAAAGPYFSTRRGQGYREGVEGEVTKGGRGEVGLRWKFWTMSCLYSCYIHKCINITIKQMFKLYISVLGVYNLTLGWPCKMHEVYKVPR